MPGSTFTVEDGHCQTTREQFRTVALVSVLYVALFVAAVNTTIITTALPTIANHFHSSTGYTWIGA